MQRLQDTCQPFSLALFTRERQNIHLLCFIHQKLVAHKKHTKNKLK